MRNAILAACVAAVCCIVIPIYGQSARKNTNAHQHYTDDAKNPKINAIDVGTVNVTKFNMPEQPKTEGESGKNGKESKSYFCRLIAPESLPNLILCLIGIGALIAAIVTLKHVARQADYTKDQVRHLINSERAWIQVAKIILPNKLSDLQLSPEAFFIYLRPYILNTGRTHAQITRIIAKAGILGREEFDYPRPPELPEQPTFSASDPKIERNIILSPQQGIDWFTVPFSRDELERIIKRKAFLYIYGRIDYTDISRTERHTAFCKLYWVPVGPSDPNFYLEDFIDTPVISPAYTECT